VKKVRITLKEGSPGKKFYLFPNAESLYLFLDALEHGEQLQVPDIEELLLEKGGFIEAELRGFEYAYEGGQKFRRLNLIRLGKAEQPKNSSGLLVTIHSGWVAGGLLPMKTYSDSDINAVTLTTEAEKLDLRALFGDDESDDSVDVDVEDQGEADDTAEEEPEEK